MIRRRRVVGVVLVALALGACSTTKKVSSKALCENAGGRYAQGTCHPGSPKSAEAMCLGFGGLFMVDEDLCHIPTR